MTERALVALACAQMQLPSQAAEDGHVAGLQVRHASWWEEAQHDVWESGLHGGEGGVAGVDAGMSQRRIHVGPSLLGFSTLSTCGS